MAIILHNQHDKASRDFVGKYGSGHIIIQYPECVSQYPNICGFPSVVIDLPEKVIEEYTIKDESESEYFVEKQIIPAHKEIVNMPTYWKDVEDFISNYISFDPGAEWR